MAVLLAWVRNHTQVRSLALWLLPSFMLEWSSGKARSKANDHNILVLDGLRGLSCLAVLNMHWAFAVNDSNENGSAETNTSYLFHGPFWYLLWAGTSHVYIFFFMSGYVLSIKCLRNIHQGVAVDTLITSAVFRRATRIFMPPAVLLLIYLFAIQAGVFNYAHQLFYEQKQWRTYQITLFEAPPHVHDTFAGQMWDVLGAIGHLIDPYSGINWPNYADYDSHLWTMPTEYVCSVALYTVLTATCRLYTPYRLIGHSLLVLYCWLASHQSFMLFFAGMTAVEVNILYHQRHDPQRSTTTIIPLTKFSRLSSSSHSLIASYLTPSNLLSIASTWLGLYLLSMPLLWADESPHYRTLHSFMPHFMTITQKTDALRSLGAVLTVWPITYNVHLHKQNTPILNLLLANPIAAYLGNISFSLYLVHGFVIRSLGYSILPWIYEFVVSDPDRRAALTPLPIVDEIGNVLYWEPGAAELTAREVGWMYILGYVVVLPVSVWMADLFWRGVDGRCVRLGVWLEEKMSRREVGSG